MQAKKWVYTLNNPSQEEQDLVENLYLQHATVYHVAGQEVGESGTPHVQGFVIFNTPKRLTQVRPLLARAHWESSRGTALQASDYCKKEGNFKEWGTLPAKTQGKRNDWERLREYVDELGQRPTRRELLLQFPHLMGRYERTVHDYVSALFPEPSLTDSLPRDGWQLDLVNRLLEEPEDRLVDFIYDFEGGKGKSWVTKYFLTHHSEKTQVLRIGKRDDLAMAIDPQKSIFFIDVPRTQMEYLQYSVLESLKDRIVFSPKYHSSTKILSHLPHVVVLCNEYPDRSSMTSDRFNVITI